uniref:C-type lectin domain-containing protein n=1 Tax=Caenorhabditis tropicalis TaxID=1561998 RepID=A0A1I7TEV7_9PELO
MQSSFSFEYSNEFIEAIVCQISFISKIDTMKLSFFISFLIFYLQVHDVLGYCRQDIVTRMPPLTSTSSSSLASSTFDSTEKTSTTTSTLTPSTTITTATENTSTTTPTDTPSTSAPTETPTETSSITTTTVIPSTTSTTETPSTTTSIPPTSTSTVTSSTVSTTKTSTETPSTTTVTPTKTTTTTTNTPSTTTTKTELPSTSSNCTNGYPLSCDQSCGCPRYTINSSFIYQHDMEYAALHPELYLDSNLTWTNCLPTLVTCVVKVGKDEEHKGLTDWKYEWNGTHVNGIKMLNEDMKVANLTCANGKWSNYDEKYGEETGNFYTCINRNVIIDYYETTTTRSLN